MNFSEVRVAVIGAGPMGLEYSAVLSKLRVDHQLFSRAGPKLASSPEPPNWLKFSELEGQKGSFSHAIVAVPVENLARVGLHVLELGIGTVLLEKPGFLVEDEFDRLNTTKIRLGSRVVIGYNRRFYPSIDYFVRAIKEDGGLTSLHFEFSEGGSDNDLSRFAGEVRQRWLVANSSHVIDLAKFVGGEIADASRLVDGESPWHQSGSFFAGFGNFVSGVPFSFRADLNARDRWSLTGYTRNRTVHLSPLEKVMERHHFLSPFEEKALPTLSKFKPGILEMVQVFLTGDLSKFPSLEDQSRLIRWINWLGDYR